HWSSRHHVGRYPARLAAPSWSTSEPSSRSCRQSNQWPPIGLDTRPDGQTPAGPLAPVLQVKIACSCLSWLHSLKIRSLRESRGDSICRRSMRLRSASTEIPNPMAASRTTSGAWLSSINSSRKDTHWLTRIQSQASRATFCCSRLPFDVFLKKTSSRSTVNFLANEYCVYIQV